MKLLMEQWRGFLQEGRYEAATTELTRKVIPYVKYIIDEVLPGLIENPPRKDLTVVTPKRFERGTSSKSVVLLWETHKTQEIVIW